jgi:tetratricopeptide (TPR) repeat protein
VPGQDWQRIEDVFLASVDLSGRDRESYLAQVCVGDPDLRAQVDALLRADTTADRFISSLVESEVRSLLGSVDDSMTGTLLGRYRIVAELGRGGMGTVYLGERDDEQFRKEVAIKVVKRGMDSSEVLQRFRHERQILAGLEHPYIARLIDGGSTPDGRPYFVMEYVKGTPIDVYCREHKLDIAARLRLFLRVCEAVSYAHRALVVHRDLKPSNILVTTEGVPKLLDFGVAKLLDSSDLGLTVTQAMGPLTPEYASPEQVQGERITTAADVYALGAILFELLTDTRAQRIATVTPSEIERVVCREATPLPSAVVRNRRGAARLDGELDNIVLMAMRKEPERRYRSASQLAEDVQRYQEGRPVLARQDSLPYRMRKFLRRHALLAGAAALIVLSMVGGTAAALVEARRARTEQQVAETQRQAAEYQRSQAVAQKKAAEEESARAEREKQRAETESGIARAQQERSQRQLTQTLQLASDTVFHVHSSIARLPGSLEPRKEIVQETIHFLESLSKDAAMDDNFRLTLAVSYIEVGNTLGYPTQPNLGDSKGALENYRKAISLLDPLMKKNPNNQAYIQEWVEAQQSVAAVLTQMGKSKEAVDLLLSAAPFAHRLEKLCPAEFRCWLAEGNVYSQLVETTINFSTADAFRYSMQQVEIVDKALQRFPNEDDVALDAATAYSQQAKIRNARGELGEAVDEYKKAAALRERALQRNPNDVLARRNLMITYGNLGATLGSPITFNLGNVAGARESYGKALAIARGLSATDPTNQLAQYDLANALMFYSILDPEKEQWEECLANLAQAETILQKFVTADGSAVGRVRTLALAKQYKGQRLEALDRRDEAIVTFRQSLEVAQKALERSPQDLSNISQVLASQEDLAETLARNGARLEAISNAEAATHRAEAMQPLPSENERKIRSIAIAYQSLGNVHATLGEWPEAVAAAEKSVSGWNELQAAGSKRLDPKKIATARALLENARSHLQ